jgi:GNAT superfamily N-acetyltransferase
MEKDDIEIMSHEGHSFNVYMDYFNEQELGSRYVFISEYNGDYAGYTTLKNQATSGPFANTGIPEISDFNVLNRYRCKGIGSMILDEAEKKAGELNVMVCLGVGLHSGYGSAQRMYVKRGYLPDGSGVWYKDKICAPYTGCINDDDLILYLSKQLAEV